MRRDFESGGFAGSHSAASARAHAFENDGAASPPALPCRRLCSRVFRRALAEVEAEGSKRATVRIYPATRISVAHPAGALAFTVLDDAAAEGRAALSWMLLRRLPTLAVTNPCCGPRRDAYEACSLTSSPAERRQCFEVYGLDSDKGACTRPLSHRVPSASPQRDGH